MKHKIMLMALLMSLSFNSVNGQEQAARGSEDTTGMGFEAPSPYFGEIELAREGEIASNLKKAYQNILDRKFDEAIQLLQPLSLNKEGRLANYLYGIALKEMGRYELALEQLELVLEKPGSIPTNDKVHLVRAWTYCLVNDYSNATMALKNIDKALDVETKSLRPWLYMCTNQYLEAEKSFEPKTALEHYGRATARFKLKRDAEAILDLKTALNLNPSPELKKRMDSILNINSIEDIYNSVEEPQKALYLLEGYLLKNKGTSNLLTLRGLMYVKVGNKVLAQQDFKLAIAQDPKNDTPYINLIKILIDKKDYVHALNYANQGLSNTQSAELYNSRGNIHYFMGNNGPALSDFNESLKLKGDYLEALYNRGLVNNPSTASCLDFTKVQGLGGKFEKLNQLLRQCSP